MPHITIYTPDREEGRRLKNALADIAAGHGLYTTTGKDAGDRGNVHLELAAQAAGDIAPVKLSGVERDATIDWLKDHAYQPGLDRLVGHGLFIILASLVAARDRANDAPMGQRGE